MFDKVSLNEACQKMGEYKKKIEELKTQGAFSKGDRELDKQYMDLLAETARYALQFSEDECYAITGKCAREAELEEINKLRGVKKYWASFRWCLGGLFRKSQKGCIGE